MNAQRELEKWKADFIAAKTLEDKADHKKRFNMFLQSLSPEDKSICSSFPVWSKAICK